MQPAKEVIITVQGRKDTVLLSLDAYQNLVSRIALLELLSGAEEDITNGRTAPITDTFDGPRQTLSQGG